MHVHGLQDGRRVHLRPFDIVLTPFFVLARYHHKSVSVDCFSCGTAEKPGLLFNNYRDPSGIKSSSSVSRISSYTSGANGPQCSCLHPDKIEVDKATRVVVFVAKILILLCDSASYSGALQSIHDPAR